MGRREGREARRLRLAIWGDGLISHLKPHLTPKGVRLSLKYVMKTGGVTVHGDWVWLCPASTHVLGQSTQHPTKQPPSSRTGTGALRNGATCSRTLDWQAAQEGRGTKSGTRRRTEVAKVPVRRHRERRRRTTRAQASPASTGSGFPGKALPIPEGHFGTQDSHHSLHSSWPGPAPQTGMPLASAAIYALPPFSTVKTSLDSEEAPACPKLYSHLKVQFSFLICCFQYHLFLKAARRWKGAHCRTTEMRGTRPHQDA